MTPLVVTIRKLNAAVTVPALPGMGERIKHTRRHAVALKIDPGVKAILDFDEAAFNIQKSLLLSLLLLLLLLLPSRPLLREVKGRNRKRLTGYGFWKITE
jgi:hypothetical protein